MKADIGIKINIEKLIDTRALKRAVANIIKELL